MMRYIGRLHRTRVLFVGAALAVAAIVLGFYASPLGTVSAVGNGAQSLKSRCAENGAVPDGSANAGLVNDCFTLLKAKDKLRGSAALNWSTDIAMSQWNGLTLGGSPLRVTELDLRRRELDGAIPRRLNSLEQLTRLDLSENFLQGEIPARLGRLANLQRLHLGTNKLEGRIPGELGNLSNLEYLNIERNELNGRIPPELKGLSSLQQLRLNNNKLGGRISSELGELSNLQTLRLDFNRLMGHIPEELGDMAKLRTLSLENNRMSGRIPRSWATSPSSDPWCCVKTS